MFNSLQLYQTPYPWPAADELLRAGSIETILCDECSYLCALPVELPGLASQVNMPREGAFAASSPC